LDNPNLTPEQFVQLTELLFQYQDIICSDYEQLPFSKLPPHELTLTDYTPIRQKQYPLSPQQEQVMEKYVDKLLKANIVRHSRSPWNSPAILFRKKGFNSEKAYEISQWRLVIDFSRVNARLLPEFQPLGGLNHASYLMAKVIQQGQTQKTENGQTSQNSKIMISSFDLTTSHYQTELTDRSSQYTAFSTRSFHVEFRKLPMGISQSPSAFCRALYRVFANEIASHNMSLYIDDAIIANADFPSHLTQLRHIFRKLRAHNS
jgi:hypothetical protein